jgi:hypothetical protein
MNNNNNPPEQAGALKKIYQARKELYEANEGDITALKCRLEQAMEKKIDLTEQMNEAKTNYDEASSKIVDLLDDDEDDNDDDNENDDNDKGLDERKPAARRPPTNESSASVPLKRTPRNYEQHMTTTTTTTMIPQQSKSTLKRTPGNYEQHMMMMMQLQPPPPPPEIVDLVDDDDDNDDNYDDTMNRIRLRKDIHSAESVASKSSSSINNSQTEEEACSTKKRLMSKSTTSNNSKTSSISSPPNGKVATDVTKKRPRSTSNLTMTIRNRIRPADIPQDRWLQSSIGRTREELNNIDLVEYMGSCKFGQSCICSKFGKVHAIVLNDEWNELVQTIDEQQLWYVGLGPGRKRDAGLVAACSSTIPIFHAPKVEYKTRELFYVGHYKVLNIKEYDPPISITDQERQLLLTFTFVEFDINLATIINNT